ncbi:MAG: hypothetical protein GWP61_24970 [Chloroflexi bacterium]|nr:hypothetical protein [Chloroflexota bacterium]
MSILTRDDLKTLYQEREDDGRFFILALSQNQVRLLPGTGHIVINRWRREEAE